MAKPVHPGRILKRELATRKVSYSQFASALHVPLSRIARIARGKRGITPETALRLARYFGNDAQFWMNLQSQYDLAIAQATIGRRIAAEVEHAA
jgi:addiction module HigA family antidote